MDIHASRDKMFHSTSVFEGFKLLTVVTVPVAHRRTTGSSATVMSVAVIDYDFTMYMAATTTEFCYQDVSDSYPARVQTFSLPLTNLA